jgi:predicted DNA repair protein MutK
MSGLLALLDDVAAIAKIAAASIDDVAANALKAGSKAAGAVIDDAAVTPKYVQGFDASRELPIIWRIARGSLINKLLILLPVGLALSAFAAWLIPPLLILGGGYLCFEGGEKIAHWLFHHKDAHTEAYDSGDPAHLEEEKVKGAIKTDFILSAEIMTISLAAIPAGSFWMEAATLAVVAIGITFAVYGSVALIVKADDVGLAMSARGRLGMTRSLGRAIVNAMPRVMTLLLVVGTGAMLWVGGSIIIHGLKDLGLTTPYALIHDFAVALAVRGPEGLTGLVEWSVTAFADGILGLALGLALIPIATRVIAPIWTKVFGR